ALAIRRRLLRDLGSSDCPPRWARNTPRNLGSPRSPDHTQPPVVIAIRVDTAQRMVSRASGLLVEIPFVELENRQEIGSGWRRFGKSAHLKNERKTTMPVQPLGDQFTTEAPGPTVPNSSTSSIRPTTKRFGTASGAFVF